MAEEMKSGGKFKADAGESGAKGMNFPIYIVLTIAVVALIAGFFVYPFVFPCKSVECEKCPECETVVKEARLSLIYSDDFNLLQKDHTLLASLKERNVQYALKEFDASSDEGKALIEKYGITSLPLLLVNSDDIKSYPAVSRALSEQGFKENQGYFVVPEANFDPKDLRAREYLNSECIDDQNKLNVIIFDTPYSDLSIVTNGTIDTVLSEFKDSISIEFVYSEDPARLKGNEAALDLTYRYMSCAASMGEYNLFDNALKKIYCGYDVNRDTLKEVIPFDELAKCGTPANKHYNLSLREGELVQAGLAVGLDQNALETCAVNFHSSDLPRKNGAYLSNYNITRNFVAVVGCKYMVPLINLKQAICELRPELMPCTEVEPPAEVETNAEIDINA